MTMNNRLIPVFAAVCVMAVSGYAESAGDIRRRMEQRLSQIDTLKAQEMVGENNRGYLEERKSGAGAVVSAENADRQAVYGLIAKETGATPDSVGQARAKQIAANSKSGVWVQDAAGVWKKK